MPQQLHHPRIDLKKAHWRQALFRSVCLMPTGPNWTQRFLGNRVNSFLLCMVPAGVCGWRLHRSATEVDVQIGESQFGAAMRFDMYIISLQHRPANAVFVHICACILYTDGICIIHVSRTHMPPSGMIPGFYLRNVDTQAVPSFGFGRSDALDSSPHWFKFRPYTNFTKLSLLKPKTRRRISRKPLKAVE